jgi:GNAT superfamily N-acetyltransferase
MTGVDLRPATPADEPFLRNLMIRTIADELGAWAWPEAIRADLLQKQYHARDTAMHSTWRGLDDRIISIRNQPAGRIAVARTADEVWIVDLLVVPEQRGSGIGTAALGRVLDEAKQMGKPVRLHVNITHRASRFYERLGFVKAGGSDVHHLMEWMPAQYASA